MVTVGYSNLSLSMEGPSQANLDCTDTENGYCEVTYMPTEPGDYVLNIKYGDRHVPGSPFNVLVTGVGSEMRFVIKHKQSHPPSFSHDMTSCLTYLSKKRVTLHCFITKIFSVTCENKCLNSVKLLLLELKN